MTIFEHIKIMRKARGLSQERLAEKAGLSLTYIAKLERGEKKNPSLTILNQIAYALECNITITPNSVL